MSHFSEINKAKSADLNVYVGQKEKTPAPVSVKMIL